MYRHGITSPKIAEGAGVAESTVRYHLHLAAKAEPGLRDDHKAAARKVTRHSSAGLRNLNDTIAFHAAAGRLPTMGGSTPRERALGVWLHRRRLDAVAGTLSPAYREALSVIPGWDTVPSLKARNETRWEQRLSDLVRFREVQDWPRHKSPDTEQERVLGVWLHVQRINHRQDTLDPVRKSRLDTLLPGWREGRTRTGNRRSSM